jgi:hypothetical protein
MSDDVMDQDDIELPDIVEKESQINLEDKWKGLFESSDLNGEEELLKTATKYTIQIAPDQSRCLLFVRYVARLASNDIKKDQLNGFVKDWLEFQRYNNSQSFIMRILEAIALKRFWTQDTIKTNIQK